MTEFRADHFAGDLQAEHIIPRKEDSNLNNNEHEDGEIVFLGSRQRTSPQPPLETQQEAYRRYLDELADQDPYGQYRAADRNSDRDEGLNYEEDTNNRTENSTEFGPRSWPNPIQSMRVNLIPQQRSNREHGSQDRKYGRLTPIGGGDDYLDLSLD
jgi:hypothetical protein